MFWHNKRVFVTGHTGFKGSWLALWLQQLGADVTGYALEPPTSPSLFALAGLPRGMHTVHGDVRDAEHLATALAAAQPDIVIHMAAQSLVRYGYANPVETYAANVMGTVHLLDAVRRVGGARAVLVVTSDKCYENREWPWGYRENEPMGGHDPYSNSKGCAELVTAAFRASYFPPSEHGRHGVALASARAGNVIGGGDWAADRLVPDTIRAFAAGQQVTIRNPRAIRPWQHVLEPLGGYLRLAERLWHDGPAYADGWNFGPHDDDAQPVGWVVDRMAELWGAGAGWQHDDGPHPHEAHYLRLDCTRARSELGWQPRLPLEQALAWTVGWQRALAAGNDARSITEAQIAQYEALATTRHRGHNIDNSEHHYHADEGSISLKQRINKENQ